MYFTGNECLETALFSMAHGELLPFLKSSKENML